MSPDYFREYGKSMTKMSLQDLPEYIRDAISDVTDAKAAYDAADQFSEEASQLGAALDHVLTQLGWHVHGHFTDPDGMR